MYVPTPLRVGWIVLVQSRHKITHPLTLHDVHMFRFMIILIMGKAHMAGGHSPNAGLDLTTASW